MHITEPDESTTSGSDSGASLLGDVTVEIAFIAEVSIRVAVPATDPQTAQEQALSAAVSAIKQALAPDSLAIARVIRDAVEPISHAARIFLVIGDDVELLVSIQPEGDDHARS